MGTNCQQHVLRVNASGPRLFNSSREELQHALETLIDSPHGTSWQIFRHSSQPKQSLASWCLLIQVLEASVTCRPSCLSLCVWFTLVGPWTCFDCFAQQTTHGKIGTQSRLWCEIKIGTENHWTRNVLRCPAMPYLSFWCFRSSAKVMQFGRSFMGRARPGLRWKQQEIATNNNLKPVWKVWKYTLIWFRTVLEDVGSNLCRIVWIYWHVVQRGLLPPELCHDKLPVWLGQAKISILSTS